MSPERTVSFGPRQSISCLTGRLVVVLVGLLIRDCQAQVESLTGPVNQAVLVTASSAQFTCTVKQNPQLTTYVSWEECITDASGCTRVFSDTTYLYEAFGGSPERGARYSVSNPSSGRYDFSISPLVFGEDGGKYRCLSLNDPSDFELGAELVLLASDPVCSSNATNKEVLAGDFVRFECEVSYQGRWAPVMRFYEDGSLISGGQDETNGNLVRWSLTRQTTTDHDGAVFSCETFFETPDDVGEKEATNTPDYTNTFPFEPLTVHYPPEDITITESSTCFTVGDVATCRAVSNPAPEYEWVDLNTTETVSMTAELEIKEDMLGYQWYQCRAYNTHGSIMETTTFQVCTTTTSTTTTAPPTTPVVTTTPPSTLSPSDPTEGQSGTAPGVLTAGAIAGICIAAVIVIIIIIVIVIVVCRRNQDKQKKANETRPNMTAGPDVIRSPDQTSNAYIPEPYDTKPPYPDDKVGHSPSPYNDPYNAKGPYDVEVPPYDDVDNNVPPQERNVENLTYADLALEDIPRSRKPIQVLDPTEYAEIRMDNAGRVETAPAHSSPSRDALVGSGMTPPSPSFRRHPLGNQSPSNRASPSTPRRELSLLKKSSPAEEPGPRESYYGGGSEPIYPEPRYHGHLDDSDNIAAVVSGGHRDNSVEIPSPKPRPKRSVHGTSSPHSPHNHQPSLDRSPRPKSPGRSTYTPTMDPNAISELQFKLNNPVYGSANMSQV